MTTAKSGGRGARFQTAMDPAAAALNASIDFDRRLLRDDVRGSQAHARMLAAVGLITPADAEAIVDGLETVAGEFERGERKLDPAMEDIHMNVESRLIELIGEPGRRLHTARSRNDQVATDLQALRARRRDRAGERHRPRARRAVPPRARARRHPVAGLHPPAARAGDHAGTPPDGVRRDADARPRAAARRRAPRRPVAAGLGRAGGDRVADRPRAHGGGAGLSTSRPTTASTPSPTATSPPRSRSRAR